MRGALNINLSSLILRLGFGLYMIFGHGWPKLMKLMAGGEIKFSTIFELPAKVNLIIAIAIEVLCAAMVALGFRSRLFVIPIMILMLVIVFGVKAGSPWVGPDSRELAMLYFFPFLTIFVLGSGRYSVDELLDSKAPPAQS